MRERFEIRLDRDFADSKFPDISQPLSDITSRMVINSDNPDYSSIINALREYNREKFLGFCWIERYYTRSEMEKAKLFNLIIKPTSTFEPDGEDCGTIYDISGKCERCGAGARQMSDLMLNTRTIPKGKDICRTISNEWVISERLHRLLIENNIAGFEAKRIKHHPEAPHSVRLKMTETGRELIKMARMEGMDPNSYKFSRCLQIGELHEKFNEMIDPNSYKFNRWLDEPDHEAMFIKALYEYAEKYEKRYGPKSVEMASPWRQLTITSKPVELTNDTKYGIIRDLKTEDVCPYGHALRINIATELYVHKDSWDENDFARTRILFGFNVHGCNGPPPKLFISPKLHRLFAENNIKGYRVEIAHLV